MKNEAFLTFLIVVSIGLIALSYIVFAMFAESVRTVHEKLTEKDKKKAREEKEAKVRERDRAA